MNVANIRNKAKYTFGEAIKPTYSCAQPADATALTDCSAQDDLGNTIPSGETLKTKVPGDHALTVTATSSDDLRMQPGPRIQPITRPGMRAETRNAPHRA